MDDQEKMEFRRAVREYLAEALSVSITMDARSEYGDGDSPRVRCKVVLMLEGVEISTTVDSTQI